MKLTIKLFAAASVASLLSLTACKTHDSCCNTPGAQPSRAHMNDLQSNGARPSPYKSRHMWYSTEKASPDSIEGKLRAQDRHWTKTAGKITVGCYVQDILEGRLDQPKGRGAIGKVTSLATGDDGIPAAKVDFGNDYSAGIRLSELSRVRITPD